MSQHRAHPERLDDLLADEATVGLDARGHDELGRLLEQHALDDCDRVAYQWAAAAVDVPVIMADAPPLPATVRQGVEAAAIVHLARRRGLSIQGNAPPMPVVAATPGWLPWLLAAACLAVAVIAWWPHQQDTTPRLAAARDALLREDATGLWTWAENEQGVTGDVVWNTDRQEGMLRLRGLRANDPKQLQYQLWIFDEARHAYSDDFAVDGGVFDVDQATGDVYVRVRPTLEIFEPVLFAVTSEPPGGVPKHDPSADPDRYRILVTAPVS